MLIYQRVKVSGEVYYGGTWYRVCSGGTIMQVKHNSCLIILDQIDGDGGATCTVLKKYIEPQNEFDSNWTQPA